jgi:hypothetical protein
MAKADVDGLTRRAALGRLAAGAALLGGNEVGQARRAFRPWQLAVFSADVTPPLGHPCMGGGIVPATQIVDRLEAIGFAFGGGTIVSPVVVVAVDWCEIRNDAYDRWREVLAQAAGTDPQHVLVSAVHQHDAPIFDLTAQRLLEQHQSPEVICNRKFHELIVQRVGRALRASVARPVEVTHIGIGQAKVSGVASNRRYELPDGTISYNRTSATRDPRAFEAAEGTIDPWLKTLSFWNGDEPLLALSHFAVHPMSYYGQGGVSADFVGMARRARQRALPGVVQAYVSGCSGNVTAGKYNDGSPRNRALLASRMTQAMAEAWTATKRLLLEHAEFRTVPLRFEARSDAGFTKEQLIKRLKTDPRPFGQCLAALGLSWRERVDADQPVDLPVLDLGPAALVLLPGESYVEFQLHAQQLRPDTFVMAIGYGESATGYIPTALQVKENDANLREWSWVAPSGEGILKTGLNKALRIEAAR